MGVDAEKFGANDASVASGESNSLGGVSMFRDIDLPEAFHESAYHGWPGLEQLERWFSPARISRYRHSEDPAALYLWNTRLSKAFLEDVEHVEVLLRNFISQRLTADCGSPFWFDAADRYHFNGPFTASVRKARHRLSDNGNLDPSADSIVAELSFDNWRFLLAQRHEVTIWRVLIDPKNGGMPYYPGRRRAIFEADVETVRHLRNRASHQEPFIELPQLTDLERSRISHYRQALVRTAARIDPEAAAWISTHSRVAGLLLERPLE